MSKLRDSSCHVFGSRDGGWRLEAVLTWQCCDRCVLAAGGWEED